MADNQKVGRIWQIWFYSF